MPDWQSVLVHLYFASLAVLSVYGLHRYVILYLYHRHYKQARRVNHPPAQDSRTLPSVTVQLPIFNELYVARRVIRAAAAIRYPRDLLRIQVLDDSTDETRRVARETADELRAQGMNVEYLCRADREGFKAGALKAGLAATPDDLVAVFDADFVPPPDFLEKTVPHFQDAGVGMVQTRWGYLNRDYSLLTRVQAMLLDGHFMLEHTARSCSGRYFNFNGTGGVFRRAAILDAGGWQGDTLTEDLDLSYRTQLRGWRFVFLPDVECPSELPVDIYGLKNQQHRWTKGSIQVGRKLLPRIWRSGAPLKVKLEATFHLSANLSYLLLVLVSLLMPFAVIARAEAMSRGAFVLEAAVFGMTTASIFIFYLVALRELHADWKLRARDIPFILAIGIGMCINNAWAVVEALVGYRTPFVRTAKYRIESMRDRWKGKLYRSARKPSFFFEFLFAAYAIAGFVFVAALQEWAALPYMGLFVAGYAYVFGLSVAHGRQ
ncbi:MAG: glycosyltransferase [Candidatus Krumholzibacteria bacterium]|nr:glycosyltransferase [Candidatus Krumholzibacteria bacterium]MDH4338067.1 glycosyltransferase [Candidatus Krumholzibacteria bacterium]MDH5270297.1 glycosyltransferase [Candidatus Krumholzibacteria bacterium]